ncbi:apolipoprotein N-acyltransferase [Persephonella sp.]
MKKIVLPAIAGLLLSLSFPNTFIPFVYIGGFFLIFYTIQKSRTLKEALLSVFIAGFSFSIFSFYWIIFAVTHYGDVNTAVAVLMFLVFASAFSAVQFVPFGAGMYYLRRYRYAFYLAPFIWVFLEVFREFFPFTGFPWNLVGYTLTYINPVAQIAYFGGIYIISFLAVFLAASVYQFFMERGVLSTGVFLISLVIFTGIFIWGKHRINSYTDTGTPKNVAVIQGNITEDIKMDESSRLDIINKYLFLMKKAAEYDVDLIVLPESAIPIYPLYKPAGVYSVYFFENLRDIKKPIISGFDNVFYKNDRIFLYNSVFLIDPSGKPVDYYSKIKLVPFGEYVPFPFDFLRKLFPYLEGYDFYFGEEKKILRYDGFKVVPLVCFEAIFPVFVADFSRKGNLLVNLTNDAWFGKTSAPFQHFEMARVRAIENNMYLVRAANTGISAIINPVGVPVSTLNLFEEGIILDRVYLRTEGSFWNRHYLLTGIIFTGSFAGLLLIIIKTRNRRSRP